MAIDGFVKTKEGTHIIKDPDARRTYGIEWEVESGDVVASAAWAVAPGLGQAQEAIEGNTTKIVLHGGTAGQDYLVRCVVTTFKGETDARSFTVRVRQR